MVLLVSLRTAATNDATTATLIHPSKMLSAHATTTPPTHRCTDRRGAGTRSPSTAGVGRDAARGPGRCSRSCRRQSRAPQPPPPRTSPTTKESARGRNGREEDSGAPPPPSSRPRGLLAAAQATMRSGGSAGSGGAERWGFARVTPRDDAGAGTLSFVRGSLVYMCKEPS